MKVLLVHNYYGSSSPSGENQVVDNEKKLLISRGNTVIDFTRHSDEIRQRGIFGAVQGGLSTPWNPWVAHSIRHVVEHNLPVVVHVHNTFPLISPSIFSSIGSRSARVMTLHNYRLQCPSAIPMRYGKVCTECIDRRSVIPALLHACYRGSSIATLPLAVNVALHRWLGTWQNHVDCFIVLTDLQRQLMVRAGLPEHKVYVKPNFFFGSSNILSWEKRGKYIVFVGRLSDEKGVRTLINAWKLWGNSAPELRIIGEGPLRTELESHTHGLNVKFLGHLPFNQTQQQIAAARLLVMPSEWIETFGMVLVEAFAYGTPVAVSNLVSLSQIVQSGDCGVVFDSCNSTSLLQTVRGIWDLHEDLRLLGVGARRLFEQSYNEDCNYQTLMHIYQQAISENKRSRR